MPFCRFLICILLLFTFQEVLAQQRTISGTIIDSVLRNPISAVSVILKKSNQSGKSMAKSATTDTMGFFYLKKVLPGNYSLTLSCIGYSERVILLEITDSTHDIGTFNLPPEFSLLNSVTVSAQRQLLRMEVGKIIFSVFNDTTLRNKMAYDAILKMPFMNTDINGLLTFKNGKKFIVLVNGYRYGLITKEPSVILKSIPAAFIKSIEQITVPQSKYANQGYESIINIITTDGYLRGSIGTLATGIDTRAQAANNGFYLYENTKFGFQLNILYENTRNILNAIGTISQFKNEQVVSSQLSDNSQKTSDAKAIADISLHYKFSDYTRANMYLSVGDIGYQNKVSDSVSYSPNLALPWFSYDASLRNKNIRKEVGFDIVTENILKKTQWDLRAKFSHDAIDDSALNNYFYPNNFSKGQIVNNAWRNIEFIADIDFTKKYEKGLLLEAGGRVMIRTYRNEWFSDPGLQIDSFNNLTQTASRYKQVIVQGSTSLRKEWKKCILQAGVLIESVKYQNENINAGVNDVISRFNYFPSVTFKFPVTKRMFLELKYLSTVTRPNYFNVGNNFSILNSQNIIAGNSGLKQQIDHEFSLSTDGALFKNKIFYYATVGYNNTEELMTAISEYDTSSRIVITQYRKAGAYQSYILSLGLYAGIFKNRLILNLTNTVGNYIFRNEINDINKKSIFNSFSSSVSYQATKTTSFNFLCFVNGLLPTFQGNETTTQDFQINVSKQFLNQKCILRLYINDPFIDRRKFFKETVTMDLSQISTTYKQARVVGFSLTYRFGKLNPSNNFKRLSSPDLMKK
ncbi:MAG: outer membrane beta-barrel protein [Sediminibacterium sp.]|nr:outer membrane beta-barrel protein [Sediminibacterium sp.]